MRLVTYVSFACILALSMRQSIERRTCTAPDGVNIVYSVAGPAEGTALVFIHGGMADRSFYDGQLKRFAGQYRVVAVDLAGHGESGTNRAKWGIPPFGADVKAVADAERLNRIVLFGNSLGGPVAVEAALLMPDRVIGVVGIDTFQDLASERTPERAREQAEMFRARAEALTKDYPAAIRQMVSMLFHKDADPAIVAAAERRMLKTSPAVASAMLASLTDHDFAASVRHLKAPLRAINGDLYPTDVAATRKVKPDFDAVVMPHMGHYPMLERPDGFNAHVAAVVASLEKRPQR